MRLLYYSINFESSSGSKYHKNQLFVEETVKLKYDSEDLVPGELSVAVPVAVILKDSATA